MTKHALCIRINDGLSTGQELDGDVNRATEWVDLTTRDFAASTLFNRAPQRLVMSTAYWPFARAADPT